MEKIVESSAVTISVSVVSHGQMHLILNLMQDMKAHCSDDGLELILTLNIDERLPADMAHFSFPIKVIRNAVPKGFGANHNQAFQAAKGSFFCVVNPDIRFDTSPFADLVASFQYAGVGVAVPLVLSPAGRVEDSVRYFPTPLRIMQKLLLKPQAPDYSVDDGNCVVDWAAGMFMVFQSSVFRQVNGFDESYFLYYEDVDICARLSLADFQIWVCRESRVIHDAQRSSHRRLKYLVWHADSLLRFFLSPVYRQLKKTNRL